MTSRKKPTAGFWITVALVTVLIGYPLSFGPACWLADRSRISVRRTAVIYRPLVLAAKGGSEPIQRALTGYAELYAEPLVSRAGGPSDPPPIKFSVVDKLRSAGK